MPRFSICTPAYDMDGYGHIYMDELLQELKQQTFQDFEVVISDQSTDTKTLDVVLKHSNDLRIRYFTDIYNRGKAACNINQCMKYAEGDIIKILYQDDFFVTTDALAYINEGFNQGAKWIINGYTHSNEDKTKFYEPIIPVYDDRVIIGQNSVGNPSNVSVINDKNDQIFMDESILYVVDCEYYFRLKQRYGEPGVIGHTLVSARYHPASVVDRPEMKALLQPEVEYCLKKHNLKVIQ